MSRQNDEKKHTPRQRKPKDKPQSTSRFIPFHPTRAQKDKLKAGSMPLQDAIDVLHRIVESDCSVTLGYRIDNQAAYATVRDKSVSWDEATCISCFHSTLDGAIRGLALGLVENYPGFPEDVPTLAQLEFDW